MRVVFPLVISTGHICTARKAEHVLMLSHEPILSLESQNGYGKSVESTQLSGKLQGLGFSTRLPFQVGLEKGSNTTNIIHPNQVK
jgi:hypothetical protein